jgi:hypothetical protein
MIISDNKIGYRYKMCVAGEDHPGLPAVPNYRTRVAQVFVKEEGDWKIRAAHWSPLMGGAGTSQTVVK